MKCDRAGNFEQFQCDDEGCFCVDIATGEELPGSRAIGRKPNCESELCLRISNDTIKIQVGTHANPSFAKLLVPTDLRKDPIPVRRVSARIFAKKSSVLKEVSV